MDEPGSIERVSEFTDVAGMLAFFYAGTPGGLDAPSAIL